MYVHTYSQDRFGESYRAHSGVGLASSANRRRLQHVDRQGCAAAGGPTAINLIINILVVV